MDIDADTLGIPDTEYDARVTMPSSEFQRIVRDLSMLGSFVHSFWNPELIQLLQVNLSGLRSQRKVFDLHPKAKLPTALSSLNLPTPQAQEGRSRLRKRRRMIMTTKTM